MLAGGNWNNGVNAGARTAILDSGRWTVASNNGARLACERRLNRRACITVRHAVTDCQIIAPGLQTRPNYVGVTPAGRALFEVAA